VGREGTQAVEPGKNGYNFYGGGWPAHEAKCPHSPSAGLQRPRYVNLASTHFLPPARAARNLDGHLDAIDTPVRSAMVPVATQLQNGKGLLA
jgi:hypothetical protein